MHDPPDYLLQQNCGDKRRARDATYLCPSQILAFPLSIFLCLGWVIMDWEGGHIGGWGPGRVVGPQGAGYGLDAAWGTVSRTRLQEQGMVDCPLCSASSRPHLDIASSLGSQPRKGTDKLVGGEGGHWDDRTWAFALQGEAVELGLAQLGSQVPVRLVHLQPGGDWCPSWLKPW